MGDNETYSITFTSEEITLPSFRDILIIGYKAKQGVYSMEHLMKLIDETKYEVVSLEHIGYDAEAMIVRSGILRKISPHNLIKALTKSVLPSIDGYELVRVECSLKISHPQISIEQKDAPYAEQH